MSLKELKENFKKKLDSVCKKDSQGHHYWEKLGVVLDRSGDMYCIWQCTQCGFCIHEPLEFL